MVPANRIRTLSDRKVNPNGRFVLYWMTAFRRVRFNFSLQRAADWAMELKRPLIVLEALRTDYRWACDRFHQFILDGMIDNERRLGTRNALYYPYLEARPGEGKGLLVGLAKQSCLVVTDDYPCFFLPRMTVAADQKLTVPLELVDSNGLIPLSAAGRGFERAYSFRRYLQRFLTEGMPDFPRRDPLGGKRATPSLAKLVAPAILDRWPVTHFSQVQIPALPLDHSVITTPLKGGGSRGQRALRSFLKKHLDAYGDSANHPDLEGTSRLSPYLHYGHLSAHQVFSELVRREEWSPARLAGEGRGQREGWWGVGRSAESFLDQLVTWRELGFHTCRYSDDYAQYRCLPKWARETLAEHSQDPRQPIYSLQELERAETHDPLWNAAQNQLTREGHIHNYLRMLWGKKILEWSSTPQTALRRMIHLNDKYALDGRDPNSYSGITWVLGRYDRAWGPERPIFGKVRYMSSANTARKLKVGKYLERFSV